MAFWLIETQSQLKHLYDKNYQEIFLEIISLNDNIHPILNSVSLLYLKPLNNDKGVMLCIDHSETLSLSKTLVNAYLQQIPKIWVRDKKNTLYYFPFKTNFLDVNFIIPKPYVPTPTNAHKLLQNKNPNFNNINKIIPVVKHYEFCKNIFLDLQEYFTKELPKSFSFYNDKVTLAFFGIEKNGLQINKNILKQHYEIDKEHYSIQNDRIYSQYNLYTTTRRPSNAFNNINFAAINKDTGVREAFTANNFLVEFDISAYHPTLIAKLIKYTFVDTDIHKTFAEMYGVSYTEAKTLTFKQLYGGIFKQYEHLEFFQKTKQFINNNWEVFNNSGEVIVPVSSYCFDKTNLTDMNPQKLFNYLLQNIETSVNTLILLKIHKLLSNKQSKIILYTYDSFMLDVSKGEETLVKDIKNIFTKFKLNVKIKYGKNYNKMKEI